MTDEEIAKAAAFDKLFAERFPSFKSHDIHISKPIGFGDMMMAEEFMIKVMHQMMEHSLDKLRVRTILYEYLQAHEEKPPSEAQTAVCVAISEIKELLVGPHSLENAQIEDRIDKQRVRQEIEKVFGTWLTLRMEPAAKKELLERLGL